MITIPYEHRHLPTAEDLPDSDETPVDNELQNDIPNVLLNLLRLIWGDRQDWFWGVDMCFYYEPNIEEPEKSKAIVPDAFLALGVERLTNEGGRLSYVLWQEKVLPILALEVISKKYNGEYDRKLLQYQDLGILYYVVYNALSGRRGIYKKHQSLEVYKLINGKYELIPSVSLLQEGGKMVWMPEIDLGIGCELSNRGNWEREWVYWYDRNSVRYPTAEERAENAEERAVNAEMIAEQERQQMLQERQHKEKLVAYLKSLGINPDEI
ncbi:Uma2 family endonuclease [Pseudanabaena sp. 'Roaring Creek']|uniref:Uma2 family endonuclease n=1 Tax=Pseudanabaena sp. 'Roaring Creek' TaxID=1681830 RepID=UPI0006D7D11F|nr:Uma2 family endonuclease [Pseudanabaena sp. 'Roaring Creek']